jgi:hypothetical protein
MTVGTFLLSKTTRVRDKQIWKRAMNMRAHFLPAFCRTKHAYHRNQWGGLLRETFTSMELRIEDSRSRLVVVDTIEAKAECTSHYGAGGGWQYGRVTEYGMATLEYGKKRKHSNKRVIAVVVVEFVMWERNKYGITCSALSTSLVPRHYSSFFTCTTVNLQTISL